MSDVEMKTQGRENAPDEADETVENAAETSEAEVPSGPDEQPPEAERSELEELVAERDKLRDQLLRTAADFDNFRKRTKKDLELAERRAREEVLREVLPVIDNLERAVAAADGASDVEAVREGVQMVLRGFEDTASRLGLERIVSLGQRFDPNLHDAFQQQETDEAPPGTIIAEYQPGYRLGDKLLRPSMVVVARKPKEAPESDEGDGSP